MIASPLKIALSHDSLVVGALEANRTRLLARVDEARGAGADLVVFPELATLGYPPRDLLHLPGQVEGNLETVEALRRASDGIGILVGHVARREEGHGPSLWNAASLLVDGEVVHRWIKALLPTYDVFDEARYFSAGTSTAVVDFRGHRLGVSICEDMWAELQGGDDDRYARSPIDEQIAMGAELLINVSASPYEHGKAARRHEAVARLARRGGCPMIYVNQVGGQDELLFDGASFAMDPHGRLVWSYPSFEEGLGMVELPLDGQEKLPPPPDDISTVCDALVMGLRDYMTKCGFGSAVVGLSGGIDSAVVCALAARALGPENVLGLLMPSPWSSDHSVADARALAETLGVEHHVIPIGPLMDGFDEALDPLFRGTESGLAEENIQARIRGNLLMAASNKHGHLLLTTGNKSELAVGYCTLYGDMAGGLAVISDVPKMLVYELARYLNRDGEIIPQNTLDKPPSAELRPGQKDEDSLPPYPVLDRIIEAYVEECAGLEAIVARGHDRETVERVVGLIHRTEYKRRQAAPGLRVTSRAFGMGRRFPIAHRRA